MQQESYTVVRNAAMQLWPMETEVFFLTTNKIK